VVPECCHQVRSVTFRLKDTYNMVVLSFMSGTMSRTALVVLDVSLWNVLTDYEDWCSGFCSASMFQMCFICVSVVL
jgi:hypothetical protein